MHLFGDIKRVVDEWLAGGYLVAKGVPTGAILDVQLMEQACERIHLACQGRPEGDNRMIAVLDTYNPSGSTSHVSFNTTKDVYATSPSRSHVNYAVLDSEWEAQLGFVLDHHPRVLAWVKNQGLGFEVPYQDGGIARTYVPDFIVRLDTGEAEPLHLVLEVKGSRDGAAQLKAETMRIRWVPGVNAVGGWGRWDFAELRSVHAMEEDFQALVDSLGESGMA